MFARISNWCAVLLYVMFITAISFGIKSNITSCYQTVKLLAFNFNTVTSG